MPYFEDNPLTGLAFQAGQADRDVDLRGMDNVDAMQRVETLLNGLEPRGTVLIRFDEARGDGVETLFLPLGRRLLEARRTGQLKRCLPTAQGNAYFIEFDSDG
jgi:hypothetical protein